MVFNIILKMIPYIFINKRFNNTGLCHITAVLILFFMWPFLACSQRKEVEQNPFLTLPSKTIRLDSLGDLIADKTGFIFSFNSNRIDPGEKIRIPGKAIKLKGLLSYLNKNYDIDYEIMGRHIILYYGDRAGKRMRQLSGKPEARDRKAKPAVSDEKKEAAPGIRLKETNRGRPAALPDIGSGIPLKENTFVLPKRMRTPLNERSFISQANPTKIPGARPEKRAHSLYVSAGITADEILYASPQINIGTPWLFASVAWRTNFKTSGFFYGLGTSIRLSADWAAGLAVSHGTLSKDLVWSALTSDTMLQINTGLTRVSLLAKRQFSNRWSLQFGPVFNFMKTNYSSVPDASIPINGHYILRPLYTIKNSYNKETSSRKQLWIGLQVGIFYRLW